MNDIHYVIRIEDVGLFVFAKYIMMIGKCYNRYHNMVDVAVTGDFYYA